MGWFKKSQDEIADDKALAEWFVGEYGDDVIRTEDNGTVFRYKNGYMSYMRTAKGSQTWYDDTGNQIKRESYIKFNILDELRYALIGGACIAVVLFVIGLFVKGAG